MSKIGIIGGVGPYAGLDLNKKIYDNTLIKGSDQDYLDVILVSSASDITDRTMFLKNQIQTNPAEGLFRAALKLENMGVDVFAVSCNTAHSPKIFDRLIELMQIAACKSKVLHIIAQTHDFLFQNYGHLEKIGLLGTLGTFETKIYENYFKYKNYFSIITPDTLGKQMCHDAIYNKDFGVKAHSDNISSKARDIFVKEIIDLRSQGAQAVIMGCTEIPLVFKGEYYFGDVLLIDPTDILARALIEYVDPSVLKPYEALLKKEPA